MVCLNRIHKVRDKHMINCCLNQQETGTSPTALELLAAGFECRDCPAVQD